MPVLLWAQYHFSFETDSGSGPLLFPGSSWEQVPGTRWELSDVGAIAGSYSLQHAYDNPESGCDYLMFRHHEPLDPDSITCSFRIRHGYAPSSANNWQLALLSELHTEKLELEEGILVGVNYRGSDDLIKVWQIKEGLATELCVTALNYQEEVGTERAPLFRLVWYRSGLLRLYYTKNPWLEEAELIGSCRLEQLPAGRRLVLRYVYSSARDRNLWMDELSLDGNFTRDSLAPRIQSLKVCGVHSLKLRFSEEVMQPELGSYLLGGSPGRVSRMDGVELILDFPDPFPQRSPLKLRVGKLCDREGNCMRDTLLVFMRTDARWGEVVFNEVMCDPTPPVRLPEEEYLELYNRSDFPLDMKNWRLEVNTRTYSLDAFTILPRSFLVLKGVALPNGGAVLALYNELNLLVHGVSYRPPWNAPEWKMEGGWALESTDPDLVCLVSQGWTYAEDPRGGTPGEPNSTIISSRDLEAPRFLYAGYGEPGEIVLHYSEPILLGTWEEKDFCVNPGGVNPLEVSLIQPLSKQLTLRFPETLQDRQQFSLEVPELTDCQGNVAGKEGIRGGNIRPPSYGDLYVNEIMYFPREGKAEYLELYNPGTSYFDLQDLAIQVAKEGEAPGAPIPLSPVSRIWLPGQYLVLTSAVRWLEESYDLDPSGSWVEVEQLPALPNEGGFVYLTDRSGATVDQVLYMDQMHMDLLDDTRGISLERLSTDRSGRDPDNWHSAASLAGYATPGEKNSQVMDPHTGPELLEVDTEVFSPDNDGFQDVLHIHINTRAHGWVISLWISDLKGSIIRQLANNHLAAPSATYTWDGEQADGRLAGAGMYVLHLFVYHPGSGERQRKRSVIGVIYR